MKSTDFNEEEFFDANVHAVRNETIDRTPFLENNYKENLERKRRLIEQWKNLSSEERKDEKDLRRFFEKNGYEDLPPNKRNYQIFMEEILKRIDYDNNKKILLSELISKDTDIFELLHSLEDIDKIKKIYRYQKKTSTDGINNEVAEQVRNCFTQGRELFESGKESPTSVKPLLYFYSLTSYAYGLIVMCSPLRYSLETLTGHHGLDYVHDEYSIKLGGDVPYGTFTDLLLSFPTGYLVDSNNTHVISNNYESMKKFFEYNSKARLGAIFTYFPELSTYLSDFIGLEKRVFPVKIKSISIGNAVGYELVVGDGKVSLDEKKFDDLMLSKNEKIDGRLKYSIPVDVFSRLNLTLIQDIYGDFFLVDSPFKFSVPEIALHFMVMFSFSNIQRYDPPLWSKVLNNKINSDVSYLISKYLAVYEAKLPYLILRLVNNIYPVMQR
ncbi:YaaC family protein [Chromobacterium subtsugae]|uniref:YaaC family protein n=1 Tax=Chromobacterium subtsugae TaxID=251747 RepID=UPI0009B9F21F|nr:YaaC family protein [Chromobacterium subtsugae]